MRRAVSVVLFFGLFAATPALAQTVPPPETEQAASQGVIRKLNAYVALLNRTLRASESLSRYASWVNMKTGPTGRERIVYGLYSLYDVREEIEKAKAAAGQAPAMPELDAEIGTYIAAYQALAPIITEADGYYERADYKGDKMAEGKALHVRLAPAGQAFLDERAKVDALFAREKEKSDAAELAMIEQRDGRKARWHVTNVMIRARKVVNLLPTGSKPIVDMPAFDGALTAYGVAVKEMDTYGAANPNSFFVFESQPRSLLSKLRELNETLVRSKGDIRRGRGIDLTWIVNDYNMMVSSAPSATDFAK